MLLWLYLHFPSLQLDGITTKDESHDEQPLIVIQTKKNAIVQLNAAAQQVGIKVGMGLATAVSLTSNLAIVEYNQKLEQTRLAQLAQWLYQVVADIALFTPNGMVLQISNLLGLYKNIESCWASIEAVLQQQKVNYHRAIANTPMAARLIARSASIDDHTSTPLSIKRYQVEQILKKLPVSELELPTRQIEQLHRIGIVQLQQLWQLSTKALGQRFGLEMLHYLGKIKGQVNHPLHYYQPPAHFSNTLELLHEINLSQVLLFPLKRMLQQMNDFLFNRELVVTSITITLHYRNKEQYQDLSIIIGSAQGEYKTERWMALVGLKVERIQLNAPVLGITLTTGTFIDKNCTNDDLFSAVKGRVTAPELISLLQAKVGRSRIVGMSLNQDHRPEFAFNYHNEIHHSNNRSPANIESQPYPLSAQKNTSKQTSFKQGLPKLRPLILLEQPNRLNCQYTILQGPERICSTWWSQQSIYRDYFIARDPQGAICWLYHEPQGQWFLHGYFC